MNRKWENVLLSQLYGSPSVQFSSVQLLSRVRLFETSWTAACQAYLSITNSQTLLKLISIESVMPFNHLILCRPLLLMPSIFSSIRVFSNESTLCIRWPKYWSFRFSIRPSKEHPVLIFRMDWLDLLAVQGLSRVFSNTAVQKHQFSSFLLNLSLLQRYICMYVFSPGQSHKKCIRNVLPWGSEKWSQKYIVGRIKILYLQIRL